MTQNRDTPPQAPACLVRPYPSSQKGGTLIVEDVWDRATHEMRLAAPDGYRPERCPGCGHGVMHVHDYRERRLLAEPGSPVIKVVRHSCQWSECRARWQMLPALVARHLWRSWRVVEVATGQQVEAGSVPAHMPEVPERTVRRWRARQRSSARVPVQVMAGSGHNGLEAVAKRLGLEATRQEFVTAMKRSLAALAGLIHRLVPGVRLM